NGDACTVGRKLVRRHLEVIGCGDVFVDTASQVENRAMAGAGEAAIVAIGEMGRGRATQVGANAYCDEELGIARTVFVLGVFGSEARTVGVGVGQIAVVAGQFVDLLLGAMQNPNRFTTPFDSSHLAFGNGSEVD